MPSSHNNFAMYLPPWLLPAVLAPLLLKELPSRGVWMAIPLCVVGVVLVSQPTVIFGGSQAVSAIGVALGLSQVGVGLQVLLSVAGTLCGDRCMQR
jgi:hypothetical protein